MKADFDFIHYHQKYHNDCGPTCLKMLVNHYRLNNDLKIMLDQSCDLHSDGISYYDLAALAESIGFLSLRVKITIRGLFLMNTLPCILHIDRNHFVVIYKISSNVAHISDPASGLEILPITDLVTRWYGKHEKKGAALFLIPAI